MSVKLDFTAEVIAEQWRLFGALRPTNGATCSCCTWVGPYESEDLARFRDLLRTLLADPDQVDDLQSCVECRVPGLDFGETSEGYQVCPDCEVAYSTCSDCDLLSKYITWTLADCGVCEICRDDHWAYCSECDGYYHEESDDGCGSNHGRCDCEAPAQTFTLRNDGNEPLRNDTRVTVTLPAGTISAEGIGSIARHIRQQWDTEPDVETRDKWWHLSYSLEELGDQVQTRQGNYAKRLSRLAHKNFGLKLTPDIMSAVGCIASDHSRAVDFEVEITRNLNLPAAAFAHEESCWWGGYSDSRCALKTNGGFGLRTFADDVYGDRVTGRAWVMPLRLDENGALKPTFDTETADAYVVFNGYGTLNNYTPARILAHMTGMTYRKIGFSCSPMYVNNDAGYLVAPEEIASKYDTDGYLRLSVDQHSNLFETESQRELSHV